MRHYARNIGDLAAATRGLDLLHRGAYDALLDAYYLTERPLPADARECYLLADARSPAERRAVDAVLARFFSLQADGHHQKRCDAELARWAAKRAGAASAVNLRWDRERQAKAASEQEKDENRNTNVIRTYAENDTNAIPPTNHEPRTTKAPIQRTVVEAAASPPTTRRKARLPDGWALPKAWGEWAQAERGWPADEVRRVAALFADHWRGKGEARADWEATWRNWVRRETTRAGPRSDAKTESRNAFAASILGDVGHDQQTADHTDPRDISGEAVRVA